MATTKTNPAPENTDDRVEVFIPRAQANEDPNFYVSVNGVTYLLPRGKKSKVPPHIAFEVNRAFAAQEAVDARVEAMIEAAQNG